MVSILILPRGICSYKCFILKEFDMELIKKLEKYSKIKKNTLINQNKYVEELFGSDYTTKLRTTQKQFNHDHLDYVIEYRFNREREKRADC